MIADLQHFAYITSTVFILLTSDEERDKMLAVEALKSGAADYIPKDLLSANRLNRSIDNAIRIHHLEARAKEAEAKLASSEEKYRTIVDKISDLVFQLDSSQNISFANSAFEILGYSESELIGLPVRKIIDSDDEELLSMIATRQVGPLSTNNLEVVFKTNPKSILCEKFSTMTMLIDAKGIWDVPDELVFKDEVTAKFIGTLCVGRKKTNRILSLPSRPYSGFWSHRNSVSEIQCIFM
ncbi:MAG: PAS domain S-box protein [Nitrospinota bacterium]